MTEHLRLLVITDFLKKITNPLMFIMLSYYKAQLYFLPCSFMQSQIHYLKNYNKNIQKTKNITNMELTTFNQFFQEILNGGSQNWSGAQRSYL